MNSPTNKSISIRLAIVILTSFACIFPTQTMAGISKTGLELNDDPSVGASSNNNCVKNSSSVPVNMGSMRCLRSGVKQFYLGFFFEANWYKAAQFCRYHGMNLISISNQQENDRLEEYIKENGLEHEHFWTSGSDQAEKGSFFWLANGRPISFTNWNNGEPNNSLNDYKEGERCIELWNRDGKGLKWNDSPCALKRFFVCEM